MDCIKPSAGCLAAANSGLKSIDRNYILVKNYISLINVRYIQLKKHVKFACCLVDNEIPSFVILDSHKGIHKHNSRMQVSYSSEFFYFTSKTAFLNNRT
jgi:hypothetical protein